ncbi:MAG: sulfonate transport system permease protein [Solirubrobacteraceae bacterium]|jgi:sulfonate transport system permease protein|nr:sulfonate transport system permease protein [Solirubrobacteraceae bacterium]
MTVAVDAVNEPSTEVFLPRRPRRRALSAGRIGRTLAIYASPLVLLVAWQLASSLGVISDTIAASPIQVVKAAVHLWQVGAPSTLGEDLRISLTRAALGLVLGVSIASVAATVAGLSRIGELMFNGPVNILNTIPFLALLPVMIMWFGIGEVSKVLLISLGAGIPMYLNLFAGIRNVDAGVVEMARAAGAGRGRMIGRVILPGALPGALVGLRFSLAYSVLGLVVAEQINANSGIGFMITQAQTYQRVDEMFLGLVIYALLGLAGDQIVRVLERALLRWRPELGGRK